MSALPAELREELRETLSLHRQAISDLDVPEGELRLDKTKPVVAKGKSVRFQPLNEFLYEGTIFHGGICNTLGYRHLSEAEQLAEVRAQFIAACFNLIPKLEPFLSDSTQPLP